MQRVIELEESGFQLREQDVRVSGDVERDLERIMAEEAEEGFDLARGADCFAGDWCGWEKRRHALLMTMHHIVSDGWSMGLLMEELKTLYGAYVRGEEDPLPELEVQYGDYAIWQRRWMEGEVLREQGEYWRKELEGAPGLLELPLDHERGEEAGLSGRDGGMGAGGGADAGAGRAEPACRV